MALKFKESTTYIGVGFADGLGAVLGFAVGLAVGLTVGTVTAAEPKQIITKNKMRPNLTNIAIIDMTKKCTIPTRSLWLTFWLWT